jgi:hypothetical protein
MCQVYSPSAFGSNNMFKHVCINTQERFNIYLYINTQYIYIYVYLYMYTYIRFANGSKEHLQISWLSKALKMLLHALAIPP